MTLDALSKYCIAKAVEAGEPIYSVRLRHRSGAEKLAILNHSFIIIRNYPRPGGTHWPKPMAFNGDPRGAILADGFAVVSSVKC